MTQKNLFMIFFVILTLCSCGKNGTPAEEAQSPAKVANAVEESTLATVTLSPKAEERLGIETSKAAYQALPGSLEMGGEIIPVPGSHARVAAPVPGIVLPSVSAGIPPVGKLVKRGEKILSLLMLPPENELLGAREEVHVRKEELSVARAKAERSKRLLASKAISEKAYEEVQAELARSQASMSSAQARLDLLTGQDPDKAAEHLSTLVLESPVDGVLQRLFVAPGQTVAASAALFEVERFAPAWIRVPVYVGDLDKIDLRHDAAVFPLGEHRGRGSTLPAAPVQGPPISDAGSASADLFFELPNDGGRFRIGQKVRLSLLLKAPEESLVIPWSAILYDMNGGSWVYVRISPQVYSRRRVEVSHFVGDTAVLTRGVSAGDEVVTAGAVEIFGTEFGVGK